MPSCVFPHCKSCKSLYRLPKLCPPSQASTGSKREACNAEIDARNETHLRAINILLKYLPNCTRNPSKHTHRICIHHYNLSTQCIIKTEKIGQI